jgi:F0F1-type ATP synthase assembly protein I
MEIINLTKNNMAGNDNSMRNYGRYSTMAFQMVVIVLGGVLLGYKLDQWLHLNRHIFLVILSILSGFFALFLTFRDMLKMK